MSAETSSKNSNTNKFTHSTERKTLESQKKRFFATTRDAFHLDGNHFWQKQWERNADVITEASHEPARKIVSVFIKHEKRY